MFYIDSNNNRYYIGQPFRYGTTDYTRFGATHEKFIELGFTQVPVQPRPNREFYVITGPNDDGSYTTTPRDLTELKARWKLKQKRHAHETLRGTDWYIIRAAEMGVVTAAVPVDILGFRSSYRSVSDQRCAQIEACSTVEELEALVTASEQLYNNVSQEYYQNPESLLSWPEPLAETYNYS